MIYLMINEDSFCIYFIILHENIFDGYIRVMCITRQTSKI